MKKYYLYLYLTLSGLSTLTGHRDATCQAVSKNH